MSMRMVSNFTKVRLPRRMRPTLLLVGIFCLGCSGLIPRAGSENQGVQQVSYQADQVDAVGDALQQAAACIEKGDDAGAVPHFQAYLAANPDHATVRVHLGEVQLRLQKRTEARQEFERYLTDAPAQGDDACRHVIHCHTRLVEIARAENDSYQEHLHRGIGLYLLAKKVAAGEPKAGEPVPEPMLFKAVSELTKAAKEKPSEARPHWYLYLTWSQLGQMHPARTSLQQAKDRADESNMPQWEFAAMSLAGR
jgi:tetratricopeptide (TPR) repeat protein